MKKNTVLNSPRLLELKKHRRRVTFGKSFLVFGAFALVCGSLVYVSRLKQFNIHEVVVAGNKVVESEAIREVASKNISGKYLWLFPKSNVFLYGRSDIKEELRENFKIFKDISLKIKKGGVLEVAVVERDSKYIWCGVNLPKASSDEENCYFLDDNGYIFGEAPYISGEVYFKFYGLADSSNPDDPTGGYFLNGNFEKFVKFKTMLESLGIKPVALYTKDNHEIKLFLSRGKSLLMGPEVLFGIDDDLQKTAENLDTALDTEPLMSNFKNKYSSLEYIDLRYGNKVYYRFK